MPSPKEVQEMVESAGGKVDSMTVLPDGHGFATASFPLPKDHWIYKDDGYEPPPMPLRMGTDHPKRVEMQKKIAAAARYAVRAATMRGQEMDFDPDALVQCMIVGLLGYHTPDALSGQEDWLNPDPAPPELPE